VRSVVVLDEINSCWPTPVLWDVPQPDLYRSWIVYVNVPANKWMLISSTILIISRETGRCGSGGGARGRWSQTCRGRESGSEISLPGCVTNLRKLSL
jgi:hypothetical protein